MRVLGNGHAAMVIGNTTVIFDKDTYLLRGGVILDSMIVAEHGYADVDEEIGQALVEAGASAPFPDNPRVGADGTTPGSDRPRVAGIRDDVDLADEQRQIAAGQRQRQLESDLGFEDRWAAKPYEAEKMRIEGVDNAVRAANNEHLAVARTMDRVRGMQGDALQDERVGDRLRGTDNPRYVGGERDTEPFTVRRHPSDWGADPVTDRELDKRDRDRLGAGIHPDARIDPEPTRDPANTLPRDSNLRPQDVDERRARALEPIPDEDPIPRNRETAQRAAGLNPATDDRLQGMAARDQLDREHNADPAGAPPAPSPQNPDPLALESPPPAPEPKRPTGRKTPGEV